MLCDIEGVLNSSMEEYSIKREDISLEALDKLMQRLIEIMLLLARELRNAAIEDHFKIGGGIPYFRLLNKKNGEKILIFRYIKNKNIDILDIEKIVDEYRNGNIDPIQEQFPTVFSIQFPNKEIAKYVNVLIGNTIVESCVLNNLKINEIISAIKYYQELT